MSIKISIKFPFKILIIISPHEPQQNGIEMNLLCAVVITLKVELNISTVTPRSLSASELVKAYTRRISTRKKSVSALGARPGLIDFGTRREFQNEFTSTARSTLFLIHEIIRIFK